MKVQMHYLKTIVRRILDRPALLFIAVALSCIVFFSPSANSVEPPPTVEAVNPKHMSLRDLLKAWLPGGESEDDTPIGEVSSEAEGGVPDAFDGLAFAPTDILTSEDLAHAVPWRAAEFMSQQGALGWNASPYAFETPESLRVRVGFWRDIYAKYTTEQGVLHDTLHIEIIYGSMDFKAIMRDPLKTASQKARLRESLIKEKKKEIIARLQRLRGHTTEQGLTGEDLRVFKMFENYRDPNKFVSAADKSRVRFQLGQRDKFILGIYYSGRYLRAMERIFRSEGLPIELTRLPFVESSFNINARSRVGASGVWQFMPRTARSYMRVNRDIDERNDPIRSTLASARLLKQNFSMLGSWPLALTGYNHGPYGVRGIVNKMGTRDLGQIIQRYSSRTFGFASENFYACFLAALEVEKNARKYFGDVKWSSEIDSAELKVTQSLSYRNLLEFYDGNAGLTDLLNSHLTSRIRLGHSPVPRGTFFRVPPNRLAIAQDFMNGKVSSARLTLALRGAPLPPATVSVVNRANVKTTTGTSSIRTRLEKISAVASAVYPALTGQPLEPHSSAVEKPSKGETPQASSSAAAALPTSKIAKPGTSDGSTSSQDLANPAPSNQEGSLKVVDQGTAAVALSAVQPPVPVPASAPPDTSRGASQDEQKVSPLVSPAQAVAANETGGGGTANAALGQEATATEASEAITTSAQTATGNVNQNETNFEAKPRQHRVRNGESLVKIAHQYGVELDELRRANHLFTRKGRRRSKIEIGQMLTIPGPSEKQAAQTETKP